MQFLNVLTIAGVLTAGVGIPTTQDPPPIPPATATQAPPATAPQTPATPVGQTQTAVPTAPPAAAVPVVPAPLTLQELRERRNAIYLMEGLLIKAVGLAARDTADEIRRIEPALSMFTTAPVKAHGTYLEDYGVFFEVEIPSVVPSVAALYETLARDRINRTRPSAAQPTALAGAPSEPVMDPDAHYVESVKQQLITVIVMHSNSLELRAHEWLTVAARDGSEAPGQIGQPSTMTLRVKGGDLADFFAQRISREEVRKRVQVRGF